MLIKGRCIDCGYLLSGIDIESFSLKPEHVCVAMPNRISIREPERYFCSLWREKTGEHGDIISGERNEPNA